MAKLQLACHLKTIGKPTGTIRATPPIIRPIWQIIFENISNIKPYLKVF